MERIQGGSVARTYRIAAVRPGAIATR